MFGPSVTVAKTLEVLSRLQRDHGLAVGDREEGDLWPIEVLLDDDPLAALGMGERLGAVGGDDHALAPGQPVVLDDVGRPEGVQRLLDLGGRGADVGPGGRHGRRSHDLLGEGLAALELGRLDGRAEAGDAPPAYGIRDPSDQRRLGPDHDEVDPERGRQVGDLGARHRVDRMKLRELADPGIARSGVHLADVRVLAERENQGVLPATSAYDEHLHDS